MDICKQIFSKLFIDNQQKTYPALIFFIGMFVFFNFYFFPRALYWDENYHIASSQKYIDGVMFMEPHPPLGKMLIAMGEILIHPNSKIDTSAFLTTDYIKNVPKKYSFAGVRFMPVLFAFLSAFLLYVIFMKIFPNPHLSFLFTLLYLFDNAIIVHSRGAMLEPFQIFFILAGVLYFLNTILDSEKYELKHYFILGILTGLALSVKINSAVLCLLFLFMVFFEYRENILSLQFNRDIIISLLKKAAVSIGGIALVMGFFFYLHFAICSEVKNNRYYRASHEYKEVLKKGGTANPLHFFTMLSDTISYMENYQKGVPRLDPCKKGENGSHPMVWPLGKKSINYRWGKRAERVRYLYLQCNPVIWYSCLAGLILSFSLILSKIFFRHEITDSKIFRLIVVCISLYLFYMISVLQVDRVKYLYHYFIPLLFTMINLYLIVVYRFKHLILNGSPVMKRCLIAFGIIVFLVFLFYSPLTYYQYLTDDQLYLRAWTDLWQLQSVQ